MAAREDLEAALQASPHDAGAFLVYADWLLEQGDPQGELIRVQHALARAPNDLTLHARDEELRRELTSLRHLLGARWALGFPRHVPLIWVGDPEVSAVDAALRSPLCRFVEGVTLSDYVRMGKLMPALAQLPWLEEVGLMGNLELISPRLLVSMLNEVVRLPRLTRLQLMAREVSEPLSELPVFPNVRKLTLSGAWLKPEDATVLRLARSRLAPGCVLRLEHATLSFDVEARVRESWPFETENAAEPGLLVEAPPVEAGRYLLAGHDLRIGSHLACDLPIGGHGLRAVHFIFHGATLREAGDLDAPKRALRDGDRLPAGSVVLRYCDDVAAARAALAARHRR